MSVSLGWLHWRLPPGLRFEVSGTGAIRIVKARSPRDNPHNYLGIDRGGHRHWLRLPLSALRQAHGGSAGSGAPRFLPLLAYDTDLPKRVRRQIHLVERQIATLPHEVMFIFTPAGQVLTPGGVTEHRPEGVRVPQALGGLMAGNIVTHNHPGGTSFSLKDVKTAIRHNVRELRAVGVDRNGVAVTYRLRRPAAVPWPLAWMVDLRFGKIIKSMSDERQWKGRSQPELSHESWTRLVRDFFPSMMYLRMP